MTYKKLKNAEKKAQALGLQLAEYGQIYGTSKFYAYWNKSGNRHDPAAVYCEYCFDENGRAKK